MSYSFLLFQRKDDKDPRVSEPGIQVCAILLANGLALWSSTNRQEFMRSCGPGAQFKEDSANLLASITGKLNLLREKSKAKFITCLFGIQEHYPRIFCLSFPNSTEASGKDFY